MKFSQTIAVLVFAAGVTACNQESNEPGETDAAATVNEERAVMDETAGGAEPFEVAAGLTAKTLNKGYGRASEAGEGVAGDETPARGGLRGGGSEAWAGSSESIWGRRIRASRSWTAENPS